ncbi:MAG TPA: hypothetical protein V6C58_28505, partial [Allocoleopsis sp.]
MTRQSSSPRRKNQGNNNGNGRMNGAKSVNQKPINNIPQSTPPENNNNNNNGVTANALNKQKSASLQEQLLKTILPLVLVPLAIAGTISWSLTNSQIG